MKKKIYDWSNADSRQVIRYDDENDLFEVETSYDLKYGIGRKITYIDRQELEAMCKALGKNKEAERNEEGTIKANS